MHLSKLIWPVEFLRNWLIHLLHLFRWGSLAQVVCAGMLTPYWMACAASPHDSTCPALFVSDKYRTASMQALLEDTSDVKICYGPQRPSVLLPSGTILMDHAIPIREGAARLAHMDHHRQAAPVQPGAHCLEQSIRLEAEAFHVELQWRQKLNLVRPVWRYAFESQWRQASHPVAFLEDFIWAHPDGATGLAPLVRDYRQQCAEQNQ